jgi:hypothetical protein
MPNVVYHSYLKHLLSGTIDLTNDTIMVMLVSGSYTPSAANHSTRADVIAHQVTDSAGGYSSAAGGKALDNKVIFIGGSPSGAIFDANNVSWTPTTISQAAGAVLYTSGLSDPVRRLITYVDLGTTASTTNGTFEIVWNNNGIFRVYGV